MTIRRILFFALLALLALSGFAVLAGASPAGAHEGNGVLVVETREPRGDGVRYVVRLTWADDGHAAVDATVTATAVAPDGTAVTPVALDPLDQDGRYAALVPSPSGGPYTVRFTAVTPVATVEIRQRPPMPVATTTAPAPPTTEAPASPSTTAADQQAAADEAADDDEGGGHTVVFVLIAAAALGLLFVPIVVQRRRSRT